MARRNNDNNPLQIRLRVKSLPKYVTPRKLYQRLMKAIQEGSDIPPSWDVEVWWRNPNTRHGLSRKWRSDDFVSAVADSNAGFNALLHDALARRIRRLSI